uniref:Spartan-like zinc binding domain-containing protein n=1 Tax=Ditylenchus dipsaci TaxID=166011 RepID=A0A915DQ64_9BILA
MIHAYLFITSRNQDRDGHGPEFQYHMVRINGLTASTSPSIILFMLRWQSISSIGGVAMRAMNRALGPNDTWWKSHKDTCLGVFIKVKEPEKPEKSRRKQAPRNHTGQTASTSSAQLPKNENTVVPSLDKGNTIGFTRVDTSFQGLVMNQQSRSTVFSQKSVNKIDSFFKGVGHKLGSSEVSIIDFRIKVEDSAENLRILPKTAGSLNRTKKQKKKPDIIILGL